MAESRDPAQQWAALLVSAAYVAVIGQQMGLWDRLRLRARLWQGIMMGAYAVRDVAQDVAELAYLHYQRETWR